MLKQSLPYIIALVVLVLLFSLLGYPLLKENKEAKNILTEKESTLRQIYSSSTLPSDELITAMEKDNKGLLDKYNKLMGKLPTTKELLLPEGANLPLFFLEEFKNVKEKVRTKAKEKSIEIRAEDLGLLNTLPSDAEAPQLIKNLYLTEVIINLLFDVGVSSIDNIELGGAKGLGETRKTDMYEDIPLILSVKCDMLSLTKLLFTLENTEQGFFIVRNFSLVSTIMTPQISGTSNVTVDERAGRGRGLTEPGIRTGSESEKRIQVNLELSLIRWK